MIIQLLGLPGSGKSHYSRKIGQEYKMKVIGFNSGLKRKFFAVLFIILHPILFRRLLLKLIIENRHNKRVFKHKLFIYLPGVLAREQLGRFYKKSIIDEGMVQFILAIYERKIDQKDLEWCRNLFNKRWRIYIIEADEQRRQGRIQTRGRIPRGHLGLNYVKEWLEVQKYNYSIYKNFIQENFKYKTVNN